MTPREIVDRLHQETVKALQAPQVQDRMAALVVDRMAMTPSEFASYVEREIALNATLVHAAGIKLE